jgi:hypothetical protein
MTLDELKSWFNEFRTNWKRAALFLAAIIVIVILVAYVTSFVGEKAKMHATSEETDTSKKEILPENEEPQKKDDKKKFQTLHEYFKTDFSNYLAANRKVGIRIFPDVSKPEEKQNYELEFRLHCDFESLTKFISAYLPSSTFPNASPISKVVAEQINEISKLLSKGVIVAGSHDLKFTGRVYIYHDTYLSDDEKDELRLFYKQKNLDPRFQGSNYLAKMFPYKRTSTD